MEKILCGHCGNVHYENFCPQWKERGIFEVDWLVECIYKHTGQENTHKSDKELASAIREEIKKLSVLRFIELEKLLHPDWNMELDIRKEELRHFLKALGIKEEK